MKSIILSVQPKWCELIASGEKTIDVRKVIPNIPTPFKVYMYQTKRKWIYKLLQKLGLYQGKVIGEFICDKVEKITKDTLLECLKNASNYFAFGYTIIEKTQLSITELIDYLDTKNELQFLYISALKIYDKPRELGEFKKLCIMPEIPYCPSCEYGYVAYAEDTTKEDILNGGDCVWICRNYIKRPPQNFMYCGVIFKSTEEDEQ